MEREITPHLIRTITVTGGFLDGMALDLTDGLNCIIGARGTGKTTVLELTRYALDLLPAELTARRSIEALVQKNLGGGRIMVAIETRDGFKYTVSRTANEAPIVLDSTGEATGLSLSAGGLFHANVYSQNEVESIAKEPQYQLNLIDGFEAEKIGVLEAEARQITADLDSNAHNILDFRKSVATLEEELAVLPGIEQKLVALSKAAGDDGDAVNQAHAYKALRDRERRAVDGAGRFLQEIGAEIGRLSGQIGGRAESLLPREVVLGPNGEALKSLVKTLTECGAEVDGHLAGAAKAIAATAAKVQSGAAKFAKTHENQELEFQAIIEKYKQAQGQSAERATLEKRRNELLEKKAQRDAKAETLRELFARRAELLNVLSEVRDRRYVIRQGIADRINLFVSPQIQVTVEPSGNTDAYQSLLEDCLRGAGLQHRIVAQKIVAGIPPADLSQLIAAGDAKEIAERAELNADQTRKVLAALSGGKVLFDLDTVDLIDKPTIQLKDGNIYKNSADLSTGQKCTSILPILLLDRIDPLLVDQPEDNLDNRFIFTAVVQRIREVAKSRQLIFITHNPNIPVLGEAKRVFVLSSNGETSHLERSGSVDQCKKEIVTLLEGGEDAFKERRKRYQY